MKKFVFYYSVHFILNAVLLVVFHSSVSLDMMAVLPAFVFTLMILQAGLFKSCGSDGTLTDTAYSVGDTVRLTNEEQSNLYAYLRHSFLAFAPFLLPIVLFLPSYWKFVAFVPYVLSYLVGAICFKVLAGKAIRERAKTEERELKEQIKKEELGL